MEYLNKDQILNVLAIAKAKSRRDHAMILLAYIHGLRASEVTNLRLNDVRNGSIDVCREKGSIHTVQPLLASDNALLDEPAVLKAWLRDRGDADGSQLVFTSRQGSGLTRRQFYNVFEACAIRAGIPADKRNPHVLKHSCAANLLRGGQGRADVVYVQRWLGHKDLKNTAIYLHVNDQEAAAVAGSTFGKIYS